jgi:uncharacterized protein (TIGR00106 family)
MGAKMRKVVCEVTFIPLGENLSLSPYIAECLKIIEGSGLKYEFHSMGTNIEGEWNEVIQTIEKCHNKLFEMGVKRVSTNLKISLRQDRDPSMERKEASVKEKMAKK